MEQNLNDINAVRQEEIDFEIEVEEFTKNKMVKDIQFFNKKTEYIEMKITTLEGHTLFVECSSQGGIKVTDKTSIQKDLKSFDTFEGLLSHYSDEYVNKFQSDLNSKLLELVQQQQNDNDSSSENEDD